jgi:hypothetical protein
MPLVGPFVIFTVLLSVIHVWRDHALEACFARSMIPKRRLVAFVIVVGNKDTKHPSKASELSDSLGNSVRLLRERVECRAELKDGI